MRPVSLRKCRKSALQTNLTHSLLISAMAIYSDFTALKRQDPTTYELLVKCSNFSSYVGRDMKPGHWYLRVNPFFVTDAQWAKIAVRILSYDSLKGKTLPEVIDSFYYEQKALKVGGETFYIPEGSITGTMQGMLMCIRADGTINT